MTLRERLDAWRYNLVPDHVIGEILQKRWTDNAIPFLALVAVVAVFGTLIPGFFKPIALQDSTRQLGEFILVVTGLTVVMLGGGIDLSVGSIFALACFATVACFFLFHAPVWVAFLAALATGLVFGAVNGWLVGYLRLRAFITTLVTFIIGRAIYDILVVSFGSRVQLSDAASDAWDFIGDGTFAGLSVSMLSALALALVTHVALTRSRIGWHVLAVGGSRRSAHNAGIRVRPTVFFTYVFSGLCSAAAGFLVATRLSGAGPGTGLGLEILALTAAVVGGNSLGGGRGSVVKGIMGAIIVLVMTNGLIRLGYGTGTNQMVLGLLLAVAVTIDIRWLKNRHKVLNEVYVAPVYLRMGDAPSAAPGSGTPLRARRPPVAAAEPIGLGELEGPEDVILDRDDHLYCGTRHGEIVRFFAPDYTRSEVFAHVGGFPLGLAFDRGRQPPLLRRRDGPLPHQPRPRGHPPLRRDRAARSPRSRTTPGCATRTTSTSRRTARSTSPTRPSATTPTTGRSTRSRTAPPAACSSGTPPPAAPRPSSTATATPTASSWRTTTARCSSARAGPAASTATGSKAPRPAPPSA